MKTLFTMLFVFNCFIHSQPEWTVMPSGTTSDLNAIWGTSPNNIYAVGNNGVILHFDGITWTQMNSGTTGSLVSIIGFSENEIYALGFNLYKFDGVNWTIVNGAPGGNVIWGTSGNNLYVGWGGGGGSGGIKHFDGTQWEDEVTFGGFRRITSIYGISATEIYAGNDEGGIYHYKTCNQGTTYGWERTATTLGTISGVWAAGFNDAFYARRDHPTMVSNFTGQLINNNCFTEVWDEIFTSSTTIQTFEGIFGFSNNKVYAFGLKDIIPIAGFASLIYEYNGQNWRQMTTQTDSVSMRTIYGIWGSDTSEVFAVGQKGLILRKGGEVLVELTVNTAGDEPDLSPGDGLCDIGGPLINGKTPCSLRAALMESNASQAKNIIYFDIPGEGPHNIKPETELPVISEEVIIEGSLNNNLPNILIDGNDAGDNASGLTINFGTTTNGRKCLIKNLIIINFARHGIYLNETYENVIQGCYIGTDPDGNDGIGNVEDGVHIYKSYFNQVGGDGILKRNIISGNYRNGVSITGSNSNNNTIENNFIGTKPDGLSELGNEVNGVLIEQDANNNVLTKNLISGNRYGVRIQGDNIIRTMDNKLFGNKIGTNINGTEAINNGLDGVYITNAFTNIIGGDNPEERNIISGNGYTGVSIEGEFSRGNLVTGNFIGTTENGMNQLGNGRGGVMIFEGKENWIGGAVTQPGTGVGNVISGNKRNGIYIWGSATNNKISGNLIGTKTGGMEELGNEMAGIFVEYSPENTIGGSAQIFRNIISGNVSVDDAGIIIFGPSSQNNVIQNNIIGLDINGINPLKNHSGIIVKSANSNIIGGDISSSGNILSGNEDSGIRIISSGENKIKGNIIGLDKNGQLVNGIEQSIGIELKSSSNNEIGGTTQNEKNVISGNLLDGILITGGEKNKIRGNYIGVDIEAQNIRKNGIGIFLEESSRNIIGGNETGVTNIISGNDDGIYITGGFAAVGNEIANNIIGSNFNEDSLGNSVGIRIVEAFNTHIGIGDKIFPEIFPPFLDSTLSVKYFPNNKIYYNQTGIEIQSLSNQIFINENAIIRNNKGIRTRNSESIRIVGNIFAENQTAVEGIDSWNLYSNNYFWYSRGLNSSIHLNNSQAIIRNNFIAFDSGDAIHLENNSTADINYNNIFNNSGFGVNNTSPAFITNAQNNWWGDPNGPGGQGSGTGNPVSTGVDFSNWLPEILAVTVTASTDTFFSPPDYNDSVEVYLGNFLNPGDILNITLSDNQNWLQGPLNYSVNLDSVFGVSSKILFQVPGSITAGTRNLVQVTAVSQTNTSHSQTDTFYIAVYQPVMTNIFVYPDTIEISPGDSIQFYAEGYDQYFKTLNFSPQWSTTGGSINSEGWFFAGTQTGSFEITATDPTSQVQGQAVVIISLTVDVKDDLAKIPTEYELYQNYPNPFNPSTTIRYAIPFASDLTITVYNILGEQVEKLVAEIKNPGIHEVRWDASRLASGVYVYVVHAKSINDNKNFMKAKKLLLLK